MRRSLLVGLVATALAAGCSADESSMGTPTCGGDLVLVAQSVPSAAFIPCFEELPGGWDLDAVSVGDKGTTVTLDSDRAGSSAATFTYRDGCDVRRVGRLPSQQEGVQIHEEIERIAGGLDSTHYFVFFGGCLTVHFDFDDFDDISHAESLLDSILLARRDELNRGLRQENDAFEV